MAFVDGSVIALAVITVGFFILYTALYRLYFHPLAGFPGPKLAGLTQWYEFYWNVILPGQFTFHLQDLHDRYGIFAPVIILQKTNNVQAL